MDTGVQGESLHGRQNRIVPQIHYPPFKKADFNRQPFFCSFYNDMKLYHAPASQHDIHQLYAAPLTTRLAFHIYMSLQLETDHNLIRFTGDRENLSHPLQLHFPVFLQRLLRPLNDIILCCLGQDIEEGRISGDTDNQILMLFRMSLCIEQGISGYYIILYMISL